MQIAKHAINWFEIPVANIDRAAKFYGTMLNIQMPMHPMGPGMKMAVFPGGEKGESVVHGALLEGPQYKPSADGVVLYLNAGRDLAPALARAREAGAKILQDKKGIGPYGFMALLMDSEGNRIALHSPE